ncbi:hypothetical protein L6272_06190, partial [Microgenomates group bacterium]|nr:hypothetical protein [Microgenomates group bacterium]
MTTASSTYAGASIGGGIANALGLPAYPFQVIGGGVGATFGSIYTTSLKLANNPGFINWIKEIRYWENIINTTGSLAQKATAQTALNKLSLKGFRIGPLSKFANFLHQRWWARLPVNGLVIADLGVKFLGWSPWAYPSLIAGDWVWQTRGAWSSAIARWFPTTPLGRWIGNQALSVQTWFTEKIFMRPIAWETSSLLGKMPVKWGLRPFWQFMQNTWSTIQPYATTVFNPGFFLGAQFLGSVFMSMGLPWGVAHLVGGLAGAGVWWGVHGIYSAIAGKGAMSLAQWSAAGWVGYFGGLIAQGLLSLLGVHGVWMQFLPLAGSLIATVGVALIPGLGGLLGSFFAGLSAYNIAWALGISSTAYAAGMAIAATVASIALVAGLTIFSGFVIFSAFWVPLQEMMHAGPQSACFNLQTTAPQTLTPGALIEVCSKFTVKEPGLLSEYGYFEHHLGVINLDIDDDHPQNNLTKVSRRIPGETEVILQYDGDYNLNPHASSTFNNTKYALYNEFCTNNPTTGLCQDLFINTFLSTYTSYETGKKTIFELQQDPKYSKFYGLKQFTNDYIDLLQQVKNDESGTKAKLLASQTVMEEIKSNYNKIVKLLNDAQGQNDLVAVRGKITDAYSIAETKAKPENNPFQEEINSLESSCPFQPSSCQEQINVYKSYPGFFSNQLSSLSLVLNQLNNPQMAVEEAKIKVKEAYQQADFTLQGLTQQIKALRETRNTIIDIDL